MYADGNHPMDMGKLIVQERDERNLERMFSNRQNGGIGLAEEYQKLHP